VTPAQAIAAGGANRARITGAVVIDGQWAQGRTWNFTDCIIEGNLMVNLSAPPANPPTINITRCRITGALVVVSVTRFTMVDSAVLHGVMFSTRSDNPFHPEVRDMPVTIRDSYLYHPLGQPPEHTEAMITMNWGRGYRFTNTAFVQQGPLNWTATATINFHGVNSVFSHCWFLWDGETPTFWTVYVEGAGNVVQDSKFEVGLAGYVYPDSNPMATYLRNVDVHTGAPISLP
jgi:hypothetical protein